MALDAQEVVPVPGLSISCVEEAVVQAALSELQQSFGPHRTKGSSDHLEVAWSFHALDQQGVMRQARPLECFPQLRALLELVMLSIAGDRNLWEDRLNIICRRYSRGQGLKKHVDRKEMFEEDVYGCVLLNTSDRALEFQQSDRGVPGETLYRLEEAPGTCFQQRGKARYFWRHGVETLGSGERVSVTWRWIEQEAAARGQLAASTSDQDTSFSSAFEVPSGSLGSDRGSSMKGKGHGKHSSMKGKGRGQHAPAGTRHPSFSANPEVLLLPGAELVYFRSCLSDVEACELFAQLVDHPSWQRRPCMFRDRTTGERVEAFESRPTISFSLPAGREYHYSGSMRIAEAFPACVLNAKQRVETLIQNHFAAIAAGHDFPIFNYCLANKYENGKQGVGKHADDERDIMKRTPIACLSLGATRRFEFESKSDPEIRNALDLESGSVILMFGATQERYLHSIPTQSRVRQARISLTFRVNSDSNIPPAAAVAAAAVLPDPAADVTSASSTGGKVAAVSAEVPRVRRWNKVTPKPNKT